MDGLIFTSYGQAALFVMLGIVIYYVSGLRNFIRGVIHRNPVQGYLNVNAKVKSLDYAPAGIITIDINGYIVSWNGGAKSMFGYNESEVLGKPLTIIIPERYREKHLQGIERMKSSGYSALLGRPIEMEGCRRKGSEFPIQLTIWRWVDGSQIFYTGIVRDITEKKQKEKISADIILMHKRGEEIEESGMWSWDILNDVVNVSEGFKRIFGIDKDVIDSGYLLRRVYYEDLPKVEEAIKTAFEQKRGYKIGHRIVNTNGVLISVEVNAETYLNEDNELVNITGTIRKV